MSMSYLFSHPSNRSWTLKNYLGVSHNVEINISLFINIIHMHIFVYTSPFAISDWSDQTSFLYWSVRSNSDVQHLCMKYQQWIYFVSVSDRLFSPPDCGNCYTMNYFDYHQKYNRNDGITCYQSPVYNPKIIPAPGKSRNDSAYESQDLYFLIRELNNGKLPVVVNNKIQETVKKIIGKGKVCIC